MRHVPSCPTLLLLGLCWSGFAAEEAAIALPTPSVVALAGVDLDRPTTVPDDIGLGERLALIAWLKDHDQSVADPQDLRGLRLAYLAATDPTPFQAAEERLAERQRLADLLWQRHRIRLDDTADEAALAARLATLDQSAADGIGPVTAAALVIDPPERRELRERLGDQLGDTLAELVVTGTPNETAEWLYEQRLPIAILRDAYHNPTGATAWQLVAIEYALVRCRDRSAAIRHGEPIAAEGIPADALPEFYAVCARDPQSGATWLRANGLTLEDGQRMLNRRLWDLAPEIDMERMTSQWVQDGANSKSHAGVLVPIPAVRKSASEATLDEAWSNERTAPIQTRNYVEVQALTKKGDTSTVYLRYRNPSNRTRTIRALVNGTEAILICQPQSNGIQAVAVTTWRGIPDLRLTDARGR